MEQFKVYLSIQIFPNYELEIDVGLYSINTHRYSDLRSLGHCDHTNLTCNKFGINQLISSGVSISRHLGSHSCDFMLCKNRPWVERFHRICHLDRTRQPISLTVRTTYILSRLRVAALATMSHYQTNKHDLGNQTERTGVTPLKNVVYT